MSDEARRRGVRELLHGGIVSLDDDTLHALYRASADEFHSRHSLRYRVDLIEAMGERLAMIHFGRFGEGAREKRRLAFRGRRAHLVSGAEARKDPLKGATIFAVCGLAHEVVIGPEDAEANLIVLEHGGRFLELEDHCGNCEQRGVW